MVKAILTPQNMTLDLRRQGKHTYFYVQSKTANTVLRNMSTPESAATGVGITCVSRTKSALSPVPSRVFKYSGAVELMITLVTRACKVKGSYSRSDCPWSWSMMSCALFVTGWYKTSNSNGNSSTTVTTTTSSSSSSSSSNSSSYGK